MLGTWKIVPRTGDIRQREIFAWWPRTQWDGDRRSRRWVWLQRVRLTEEYSGGWECVWLVTNAEPV